MEPKREVSSGELRDEPAMWGSRSYQCQNEAIYLWIRLFEVDRWELEELQVDHLIVIVAATMDRYGRDASAIKSGRFWVPHEEHKGVRATSLVRSASSAPGIDNGF
jgi:hypothetical protein